MNIQQINQSGPPWWVALVTSVVLLLFALTTWGIGNQANRAYEELKRNGFWGNIHEDKATVRRQGRLSFLVDLRYKTGIAYAYCKIFIHSFRFWDDRELDLGKEYKAFQTPT